MKYMLTEREEKGIQYYIDKIFYGEKEVDLTYEATSPYNVRQMLYDNGFEETFIDSNSDDYWRGFKHPKIGNVTLFYNAESFEITLTVEGDNE